LVSHSLAFGVPRLQKNGETVVFHNIAPLRESFGGDLGIVSMEVVRIAATFSRVLKEAENRGWSGIPEHDVHLANVASTLSEHLGSTETRKFDLYVYKPLSRKAKDENRQLFFQI
jgi:hypothetical protein